MRRLRCTGEDWAAAALAQLDARLETESSAPLAVAVSGGGDSVALLHLAHAWSVRRGRRLLVLTVDHGLNPDGSRWAGLVAQTARELGHSVQMLAWAGPKPVTGVPAAARAARHALLAEAAREGGVRVILLGHTADDRAEAEHMRAEGSTLGRLEIWSPSPAWPEGRGIMLLRPLLGARREALRAWLCARSISWIEDPANADPRFARTRARAALRGAAATRENDPLEALQPRLAAGLTGVDPAEAPGGLVLDRAELSIAPNAHRLLSAALLCASGQRRPPRGRSVFALLARLGEPAEVTATLAGARLHAGPGTILLTRDPGRSGLPQLSVAAGERIVWDGRFEVVAGEAGVVRAAGGVAGRLSRPDKAALRAMRPPCRPTLPALETPSGGVHLLRARALGGERLRAALNGYVREGELP